MTLQQLYALNDKQRFPAFYPQCEANRPSTLFYVDFKVASACGVKSVYETMANCGLCGNDKKAWRRGLYARYTPKQITELYVVMNRLIFEAYERGDTRLQGYYQRRYDFIRDITNEWSKEDQEHFFLVTD